MADEAVEPPVGFTGFGFEPSRHEVVGLPRTPGFQGFSYEPTRTEFVQRMIAFKGFGIGITLRNNLRILRDTR